MYFIAIYFLYVFDLMVRSSDVRETFFALIKVNGMRMDACNVMLLVGC